MIGKYTYNVDNIHLHFADSGSVLTVGAFCSIGSNLNVYLGGNHRSDWISTYPFSCINRQVFTKIIAGHPASNGNVCIGNDVWIGENVTILSGVTIGDGAVLAAYSHVVKDVLPYSMVGGNPAVFIKMRFDDNTIKQLLSLKWWTFEDAVINELSTLLCSNKVNELVDKVGQVALDYKFGTLVTQPSDMQGHMDTIKGYAMKCKRVIEFGVYDCTSTWAMLAARPQWMRSYDISRRSEVDEVERIAKLTNVDFKFMNQSTIETTIEECDMLFIDTCHMYDFLTIELNRHHNNVRKYILMHDTDIFGRKDQDGRGKGLFTAIEDFIRREPGWTIRQHLPHCMGLTVLARKNYL